jgi:hypothetical protein
VLQHDDVLKDYNLVYLPLLMANYTNLFNQQHIVPDWRCKTTTFNFMINKIRYHRTFMLMLLKYFNLQDYKHTLCWKNTNIPRQPMLEQTKNLFYQKIINESNLDFSTTQYLFGTERLLDQGLQYGSITNPQVYQTFLQQAVFEPTCVSLITEPVFFERETIITEKTIMAIYGGTIPVWVGGWRIADYLRNQGFDVFDDIVDHSYQDMTDPWDRCYYAIERNLHLLQDFKTVQGLVLNNKHRLQANLDLLKTNTFVNSCVSTINNISDNLVRNTVINKFSWLTYNP